MKKHFYIIFSFFICTLMIYTFKVEAIMPLTGKTIVIDVGHGLEDSGANVGKIYEKNINLQISLYLEKELGKLGANVLLTRDGDYDLSTPNARFRKKSDFDNRIKLINNANADIYLSIHLNYLNDSRYSGPQVFYNSDNKMLAESVQKSLNNLTKSEREIKQIPKDTYMYSKLKIPGVLIECGFLSNAKERSLLTNEEYQKKIAKAISLGVLEYF